MSKFQITKVISVGQLEGAGTFFAKWSSDVVMVKASDGKFVDVGVRTENGIRGTVVALLKIDIDGTAEIVH